MKTKSPSLLVLLACIATGLPLAVSAQERPATPPADHPDATTGPAAKRWQKQLDRWLQDEQLPDYLREQARDVVSAFRKYLADQASKHPTPQPNWPWPGQPPFAEPAGWHIGIQCVPVAPELRSHLNLPRHAGVTVTEVLDNSPAAKAGLKVHDIILSANQTPVDSRNALAAVVQQAGSDSKPVQLEVIKQGARQNLTVQPEGPPPAATNHEPPHRPQAADAVADQARQIQELRARVDHLQQLVEQLRRQLTEMRPHPAPRSVD